MTEKSWIGVIGLMSGTSLDGLDICYVEFSKSDNKYQFRNLIAKTQPYSALWKSNLTGAFYLQPNELAHLDLEFGKYLAESTNRFVAENYLNKKVELIASHGHTIFHQPQNKITVQIGSGIELHKITGFKVVNDFRIKDVLLGGQGAPLVPVGDHYLFSDYQACLNLGGFSNISFTSNGKRIAFDISPCNLPINQICKQHFNCEFDHNGDIAKSGNLIPELFSDLNGLQFYSQNPPKSLGFEWLTQSFMPVVNKYNQFKPADLITTITTHIANQITEVLKNNQINEVLVTGGGAYNTFLINLLKVGGTKITLPSSEIIEFKEALIFAFLGYLNLNDSINTFKSVTGASEDSMSGVRHFGHQQ